MSEEKRMLGNYEVTQSIYVGDKEVVLAVDKKEQYPFLVCYCDYHNPLSAAWATEGVASDDYLEAMEIFTDGYNLRLTAPEPSCQSFLLIKPCSQRSIVFLTTIKAISLARSSFSMPSRNGMNISTLPISLSWQRAATVQQAAEVRRCLVLALPRAKEPDGKGTMCLGKSSPNVCPIGQKKPLPKSRGRKKPRSTRI